MTLPGDRMPPHGEEPAPVWDRFGVKWSWDLDHMLLVCEDVDAGMEHVVEPGAIPAERQPYYAHPPNEAQRIAAEIYKNER